VPTCAKPFVLDSSDHIVAARISKPTGNRALDAAAVNAARWSTFEGTVFNCRKVGGECIFGVSFTLEGVGRSAYSATTGLISPKRPAR
jgi:hypothetical protein